MQPTKQNALLRCLLLAAMPTDDAPTHVRAAVVAARRGSAYPADISTRLDGREKRALEDVLGLTRFGVNPLTPEPATMSALRHWHECEDGFVYVLEGEVTLVDDAGEHLLVAGLRWVRAGRPNAHHLVNRSPRIARCLEVGTRALADTSHYSEVDMKAVKAPGQRWRFRRRDGSAL